MERTAAEIEQDRDFFHWYGPWSPYEPANVARLLAGMPAPWWIVGGWAIEAFTGVRRAHEDVDIGFLRADLPIVIAAIDAAMARGQSSD